MGGFWLMWLFEIKVVSIISTNAYARCDFKENKPSSRDAIMDKSHMKGSMRLYTMNNR